ncbi:hypothetical protein JXJ21_02740 [candidate division KSB1 bacterium]|nr:hypothetical protein [candidate division KSB1 bacterium]
MIIQIKSNYISIFILAFLLVLGSGSLLAQGVPLIGEQKIPDDPPAETTARRWWYMDGNRVWMKFFNDGMLGDHPDPLASIWPKGSGLDMNDGLAVMVSARIAVDRDGIPLLDAVSFNPAQGDTFLYFCQTYYREDMDIDPTGQFNWGFYPVRGYLNLDQEKPAISNDSNSWPLGGWPDAPDFTDPDGNTEWNGYFGRGKTNADVESYFVTNDAWDLEYQQPEMKIHFYPRPGDLIADGRYHWGGIGARIGARLFQWSHPLAQDCIFIHYDVANISDYNHDNIVLAFYIDSGIGDDPQDDYSYMDKTLDMSWIFDSDGLGEGNVPVGIMAFAFLESPGIPYDNEDNDDDGIIDEDRGPNPGVWTENPLEGPNGTLIDQAKFEFYYSPRKVGPHWTGDENQNWRAWQDLDGDGIFNPSKDEIGDDVGADGVGPQDPNYYGADEDGTEANGIPDDGEPEFGRTDKDESDQIGLTSFQAWSRQTGNAPWYRMFCNDSTFYELTANYEFNPNFTEVGNVLNVFASGPIPLKNWTKERFSLAELHSWDRPIDDQVNWSAPALFQLKKTVQRIYNANYRFAKPPDRPVLKAIPGDGMVTLSWGNIAEKSKEPFYNYIEDFEGYKIIKSTEPYFEDARVITDGYGSQIFLKPIAQYDKIDDIKGFADWAVYNGVSFYLGEDTGLRHSYVDRNVTNGRTYYYAVVAYDFGWEKDGLSPSENTATITLNQADSVVFIDRNCAMVTPRAYAAGYIRSEKHEEGWLSKQGTGLVQLDLIEPDQFKGGHEYLLKFDVQTTAYDPEKARTLYRLSDDKVYSYYNSGYFVIDVTDSSLLDTVLFEPLADDEAKFESPMFDGMRLRVQNDIEPKYQGKAWEDSDDNKVLVSVQTNNISDAPWDFSLHFVEDSVYTTPLVNTGPGGYFLPNMKINVFALNHNFFHKIFNGTDSVMVPDTAAVIVVDADTNGHYELKPETPSSDYFIIGEYTTRYRKAWGSRSDKDLVSYAYTVKFPGRLPRVGSVLNIYTRRPFTPTDAYKFSLTEGAQFDMATAKFGLNNIKVVPNPYIATNLMEPKVRQGLNQRRRLMFTHLPAKCKISIYTVSGYLVDEIDVDNVVDDGHAMWDMLTREGLELSYGLYIYRVDAPGIGEIMGKFAVVK